MRRVMKTHTEEFIIVSGIILVMFISYLYGDISNGNGRDFLMAALPSAFIDVISVVVTTILIANLIDEKRKYSMESRMYQILHIPHKKMVHMMIWKYKFLIIAEKDGFYNRYFIESKDFNLSDIKDYFLKNISKHFQNDIIKMKVAERYFYKKEDLEESYVEIRRIELMEEYRSEVIENINIFLNDYSQVATPAYLGLLVEIREYLTTNNPLSIFCEETLVPVELDIERFTEENQEYLNKVLKLKNYFIEVQKG